jgi:hypothetical protein
METAVQCFNERGWKLGASERPNLLRFGFNGQNASFQGIMDIDEDDEETLVLFVAPNKVPETRRVAVAEFLTRVNYGIKHGCFEMDMADGEVRFKVSAVLCEGQLSQQMVHKMIGLALITLDRCYPALMAVTFANQAPSDAANAFRAGQPGAH